MDRLYIVVAAKGQAYDETGDSEPALSDGYSVGYYDGDTFVTDDWHLDRWSADQRARELNDHA